MAKPTSNTGKKQVNGIPSFSVDGKDYDTIHAIAKRAAKLADKAGFVYPLLDADMDITATHANGNPLRLKDLLAADDNNFSHDVFGIRRHLDRNTGKLGGFFLPRYSAKGAKS